MNILGDGSRCDTKFFCRFRLGKADFHEFNGKIGPDLGEVVPDSFFTGKYHDNIRLKLTGMTFRVFGK